MYRLFRRISGTFTSQLEKVWWSPSGSANAATTSTPQAEVGSKRRVRDDVEEEDILGSVTKRSRLVDIDVDASISEESETEADISGLETLTQGTSEASSSVPATPVKEMKEAEVEVVAPEEASAEDAEDVLGPKEETTKGELVEESTTTAEDATSAEDDAEDDAEDELSDDGTVPASAEPSSVKPTKPSDEVIPDSDNEDELLEVPVATKDEPERILSQGTPANSAILVL